MPEDRIYTVTVVEHPDDNEFGTFDGCSLSRSSEGQTLITGPIADQAARHRLIKKVQILGMTLVSIQEAPKENRMNASCDGPELRKTARITGWLYLIVFVSGMIAEFVARAPNIVPGNAEATAANIVNSGTTFRIGIAGDLVMIIADVGLGFLFYQLLKPVSRALAALAAMFRLAQASTLGINLLNLFLVLEVSGDAAYLQVFSSAQLDALTLLFAAAHGMGYTLGLVFFGVSLLLVGILSIRAPYLPTVLGVLLTVAAVGYLLDTFAQTLMIRYNEYASFFDSAVLIPAFIGELAITVYLLVFGIRKTETEDTGAVPTLSPGA